MNTDDDNASDRYRQQAELVMRMAAKAETAAEHEVYRQIAEGWSKLAAEAQRSEREDLPRAAAEPRSFRHQAD